MSKITVTVKVQLEIPIANVWKDDKTMKQIINEASVIAHSKINHALSFSSGMKAINRVIVGVDIKGTKP